MACRSMSIHDGSRGALVHQLYGVPSPVQKPGVGAYAVDKTRTGRPNARSFMAVSRPVCPW